MLGWLSGYLKYMDRDGDVASAYRISGGARTLYEAMEESLKTDKMSPAFCYHTGDVVYYTGEITDYYAPVL